MSTPLSSILQIRLANGTELNESLNQNQLSNYTFNIPNDLAGLQIEAQILANVSESVLTNFSALKHKYANLSADFVIVLEIDPGIFKLDVPMLLDTFIQNESLSFGFNMDRNDIALHSYVRSNKQTIFIRIITCFCFK